MLRFLRPEFGEYFKWEYLMTDAQKAPRRAEWARQAAERETQRCDICSGRSRYLCPICREPVGHSHENDYICETHSFVNPIRESDGARINGDGSFGSVRATSRRDYLKTRLRAS